MAKFKINWLEKKNNDWIVANILNEQGIETKEVSINRTAKNGQVFPNFDTLAPGVEVDGEPWTSQAGKNYLFAPKPETSQSGRKPNMDRIIEKKQQGIAESQERKERSIAQAQDRSALMWAKTNASTILANRTEFASQSNEEIAYQIMDLATKIYNGDLLEPF